MDGLANTHPPGSMVHDASARSHGSGSGGGMMAMMKAGGSGSGGQRPSSPSPTGVLTHGVMSFSMGRPSSAGSERGSVGELHRAHMHTTNLTV